MVYSGMNPARAQRSTAKYWWLGLLVVCASLCLIPFATQPNPKVILASIPVGSKLSQLDKHLGKFYDGSSVREWVPESSKGGSGHTRTKYGSFDVRELGEYDDWMASSAERDAFTGELSFYHYSSVIPDDLAPSYVFQLIYVNGVLKEKDYGHLPG